MLSNFDLNHLLTFPLKETESRKQFLIGMLIYLAHSLSQSSLCCLPLAT